MARTLTLEIVTPEKVAFGAAEVDFVVLPAANGEMGVLPGHAPFLVGLAPGEIRIHQQGLIEVFAVAGGYADVRRDGVSVFAEAAELPDEIDAERARQAFEKAKAELMRRDLDPLTLAQAEAAAKRAAVRLRVAEIRGVRRG
jgi:F-type H+-transporting ATPase subunit epsilon